MSEIPSKLAAQYAVSSIDCAVSTANSILLLLLAITQLRACRGRSMHHPTDRDSPHHLPRLAIQIIASILIHHHLMPRGQRRSYNLIVYIQLIKL